MGPKAKRQIKTIPLAAVVLSFFVIGSALGASGESRLPEAPNPAFVLGGTEKIKPGYMF